MQDKINKLVGDILSGIIKSPDIEDIIKFEVGLPLGRHIMEISVEQAVDAIKKHHVEIFKLLNRPKFYSFQGIVMEEVCPVCNGDPDNSPDKNDRGRCNRCLWRGKILTPEGKKLVDFLTNYLPFSQ